MLLINASLTLALAFGRTITGNIGVKSILALAPTFAGMLLGQKLRFSLPEARFRPMVQVLLWLIGAWLALRAFR